MSKMELNKCDHHGIAVNFFLVVPAVWVNIWKWSSFLDAQKQTRFNWSGPMHCIKKHVKFRSAL